MKPNNFIEYKATIKKTYFGKEPNVGNYTCELYIERDNGVGCNYGGYTMNGWNPLEGKEDYASIRVMTLLMEAVGVKSWEELVNHPVRIKVDYKGRIDSIGHITEEKWFSFKKYYNREYD